MYLTNARSLPSCKQKRDIWIKQGRLVGWMTSTTAARCGVIVVSVLTQGLGAWAFALEPAYDKAAKGQQRKKMNLKADLEKGLGERVNMPTTLRQ